MHFYLEKRTGDQWKIIKIGTEAELLENIDDHYRSFFISSEIFDESRFENFYDDEFFAHAIEGLGGRYNKDELEMLSLRIISKTPDKKVKSFIDGLVKSLKINRGMALEWARGKVLCTGKCFITGRMFRGGRCGSILHGKYHL